MSQMPVFKKDTRTPKRNYRPVSILPVFSKIFERLLSKQLLEFFDNILSKIQCGFRKDYRTQHCSVMFLILKVTYFTGYADDNTPFVFKDN